MKLTVLSHNLSSNAVMRAHRLASAAATFSTVELIGPVEDAGQWPALPNDVAMRTVPKRRFPEAAAALLELAGAAGGDVLLAVKPCLASFGIALAVGERRAVPVVLDLDDLEQALAPRSKWQAHPSMADLRRPGSAVYTSLLLRAAGAAAGVTVASSALQNRFGGVLVPHGADTELFDPAHIDREAARQTFGFEGPRVVFAGTPRGHKGVRELAEAVGLVPRARLAVLARATDLAGPEWKRLDPVKLPLLPYEQLPCLLAAADVVAIPQLDTDAARHQMPMKVFDAMAMGRPIVATAVSDLPEVLDGCGTLVPPGEVEPLAQAIRELLDDPAEAAALGERARRRCIERYALPRIGDRLREAITAAAR